MPETRFIETEALLKAMADSEADSGNTELTVAYLREHFLPGELRRFDHAVALLSDCITEARASGAGREGSAKC